MAAARSVFLGKGYYAPLREALCALAVSMTGEAPTVLDAGCGEGYYTGGIYRALQEAGKAPQMAGTDISKFILRRAAKREKDIEFAVASSYRLPMAAGECGPDYQLLFTHGGGGVSPGPAKRRRASVCGAVGKASVGAEGDPLPPALYK